MLIVTNGCSMSLRDPQSWCPPGLHPRISVPHQIHQQKLFFFASKIFTGCGHHSAFHLQKPSPRLHHSGALVLGQLWTLVTQHSHPYKIKFNFSLTNPSVSSPLISFPPPTYSALAPAVPCVNLLSIPCTILISFRRWSLKCGRAPHPLKLSNHISVMSPTRDFFKGTRDGCTFHKHASYVDW